MDGSCWNLFVAMIAAFAFVYQVDILCDWIEMPRREAGGWVFPVVLALSSFVIMLVNAYLFMRS